MGTNAGNLNGRAELLDHINEGCQLVSPEWRYLYVNAAAARQGKSTPEALIGRTMMECYPGIEQTPMFPLLRRCMEERVTLSLENEFTFPDGSLGWFELRFEPVPRGVFILSSDITPRKRVEVELLQSREEYRRLVESLEGIVFSVDAAGYFTFLSPVISILGYSPEDYKGKHFTELVCPEDRDRTLLEFAEARRGHAGVTDFGTTDARGKPRHFRCRWRGVRKHGELAGFTGILYDRTEQRHTHEQLLAAQRMESVGRLAGGVAHDFNNLLSVILSYAEFAIDALPAGSEIRSDLEQIRGAGERAAALTKQLLAFSRRQVLQPQVVNLNEIVSAFEPMLRRLVGTGAELSVIPDPALGNTMVDPVQMEQVIMNLVSNARDAVGPGGKITITTSNVHLDEDYANLRLVASPGPHVLISVSDDGCGMDAETRTRAFEPFFTTKPAGKGTGLGLATVFGIVKQSGGNIWVYSEPGLGTTFRVYLPRVMTPVEASDYTRQGVAHAGRNELILVAEDEEAIRVAAERMLRSAGYRVITASNGQEAFGMIRANPRGIQLLLTDVVMPGLSGGDLARKLRKFAPNVKIMFMSGYNEDASAIQDGLPKGAIVLMKPFSAAELASKVRLALSDATEAAGSLSQRRIEKA